MRKSHSFTLLELLLVIALLCLVFVGGGMKISSALQNEKFEKETKAVIDQIALAEELMIDAGGDVYLTIEEGVCHLTAAHFKKSVALTHILRASFNDKQALLYFEGNLGIPPKGRLLLQGKRGEKTISLSGIPGKINEKEKMIHETGYPQKILSLA